MKVLKETEMRPDEARYEGSLNLEAFVGKYLKDFLKCIKGGFPGTH